MESITMTQGISGTLALICLIWVLYEVWAVNKSMTTGTKVLWSLGAIFFNIITAIVYYLVVKREQLA